MSSLYEPSTIVGIPPMIARIVNPRGRTLETAKAAAYHATARWLHSIGAKYSREAVGFVVRRDGDECRIVLSWDRGDKLDHERIGKLAVLVARYQALANQTAVAPAKATAAISSTSAPTPDEMTDAELADILRTCTTSQLAFLLLRSFDSRGHFGGDESREKAREIAAQQISITESETAGRPVYIVRPQAGQMATTRFYVTCEATGERYVVRHHPGSRISFSCDCAAGKLAREKGESAACPHAAAVAEDRRQASQSQESRPHPNLRGVRIGFRPSPAA